MKENNLKNTYFLAYGAAIAAIYVALTMAFQPISFGPVQFRISEALCILPFFTPAAIPGLFVGCFLSNLFCGAAGLDIVFGSLATLIGAVGSYALRKSKVLVCVPPILANTIIVPWVLRGSDSVHDADRRDRRGAGNRRAGKHSSGGVKPL